MYFLLAYLVYNASRWIFLGDHDEAVEHALWIADLERETGIAIERPLQDALAGGAASWMFAHVYLAAQFIVLPAALIWLHRRARPLYRTLRRTILTTWMLSVPIFALFPVAPPRLTDPEMSDTVSASSAVRLTGRSTRLYNPYAAVPSLHVGFAFAIAVALAAATASAWKRALALLWGPAVAVAVVATANHYVFDVLAGVVVTAAAYGLAVAADRAAGGRRGYALLSSARA